MNKLAHIKFANQSKVLLPYSVYKYKVTRQFLSQKLGTQSFVAIATHMRNGTLGKTPAQITTTTTLIKGVCSDHRGMVLSDPVL